VTACVRPERVSLLAGDAAAPNALRASVSDLIYFGDHVRVRCAVGKQEDCFVKIALNDKALPDLAAGTPVWLGIEPERLRIFN
jgi:putative spermidine/putrescine transport system ATP-binding protein